MGVVRSIAQVAAVLVFAVVVLVIRVTGSVETASAVNVFPDVNPYVDAYFPETGQVSSGPFLAYWMQHRDIGSPVSPPSLVDGEWVQWFEYAKLALVGTTMEAGTSDGVFRAHVGRLFADTVGYSSSLDAFQYHEPITGRYFPETGHTLSNGFLAAYERWGVGTQLGLPISEEFRIGKTTYQFFEFGAFSWAEGVDVQRVPVGSLHAGMLGRLGSPQQQQPGAVSLESATMYDLTLLLAGERWIDVDLNTRVLTAYVGSYPVMTSVVDIGHINSPTVRGTFNIYLKNRVQTLRGETWDGTPYNVPDVPYVMYFWQDYAIHPSASRTAYGEASSPGCVIPPLDIAEFLWEFAEYGTRVVVR